MKKLAKVIEGLDALGHRISVPSVRKYSGVTDEEVIRKAIRAFKERKEYEDKQAAEKAQKPVYYIEIDIEWRDSRTWGSIPTAYARVQYSDGSWERLESNPASGCGYDKHSTVVAGILNQCLKGMLWKLTPATIRRNNDRMDKRNKYFCTHHGQSGETRYPYAFALRKYNDGTEYRSWSGGVGMSVYPDAIEWLGGKMVHTHDGKRSDGWSITFPKYKPRG